MRAHDAEAHVAAARAHGERRNDGVHRPFSRTESIGVIRLERKAGAAIGQQDAGLLGADAGAEVRIERIDERYRHAVAVDHAEINRVAAGRWRCR